MLDSRLIRSVHRVSENFAIISHGRVFPALVSRRAPGFLSPNRFRSSCPIVTSFPRLHRLLPWLNLPTVILLTLLQRTPVVRIVASAAQILAASPAGAVLKATVAALGSLGAVHSLAGATQLVASIANPYRTTIGVPITTPIAITVTGAVSAPQSFNVTGPIPPGISISGLTGTGGKVNASSVVITGTPTTGGTFTMTIRAYELANLGGTSSVGYPYSIVVVDPTPVAPQFTQQPVSQTLTAGANVTFSVSATGMPAPTLQWRKDGVALPGATSSTYSIPDLPVSAAGVYSAVATNATGTATSTGATLTVRAAPVSTSFPVFTTQPSALTIDTGSAAVFNSAATNAVSFRWQRNNVDLPSGTAATLTLASATSADAGTYRVIATNTVGSTFSNDATLVVRPATPPVFSTQPSAVTVDAGTAATFTAAAANALSFRWQRDSVDLPGATAATLNVATATAADAGTYRVIATNAAGSTTSSAVTLTVRAISPNAEVSRLVNLSVRAPTGPGAKVLTVGAVVGPLNFTGSLPLLLRAVGPTLGVFGVAGVLADPVLTLNVPGTSAPVATNDNWGGLANVATAFTSVGAFALGATSLDSATLAAPNVGGLTVQVTGKGEAAGVVLAEIYDHSTNRTAASPRLVNLSTLTQIDAGASLTVGFVLRGATSRTVLVRGVGPTLGAQPFGIVGVMSDPRLELFNNDTGAKLAENDNWSGATTLSAAARSVGAFPLVDGASKDAVLLISLPPGTYSARISGVGTSAGTAIVEVYEVP